MVTVYTTCEEVAQADARIAIIPIGAIEQHGRHLPLGTDWLTGSFEVTRYREPLRVRHCRIKCDLRLGATCPEHVVAH